MWTNRLYRAVAAVFLLEIALSFAPFVVIPARSQEGSTGGVVGKQNKSASGGENRAGTSTNGAPRKPHESSPDLPAAIHLNEHNATWGEFSTTLRRVSGHTYRGVWNHGIVSEMIVAIDGDSMTMERRDISGGINLCHGHYVGTRSPGASRASGEDSVACTIGGASSTWDASW